MSPKIHVLHVIESLQPYGGTPLKLLWQVLNSATRFKFTMCCTGNSGGLAPNFQEAGIEVITLDHKKKYDLRQIHDIVRIIRERNIDIVHTHFARSNTYGRIAAILTGKPMIVSEHGISRNTSPSMYFFDSFLNLFTAHHVSNSYATLRSAKKTVLLNRRNMSVLYNGVPDPFMASSEFSKENLKQEHGFQLNDFIILNVGGHVYSRSHITLIEAIFHLRTLIPRIKVVLIGDGPARIYLKNAVNELKLEKHILFWGYIELQKVHSFIPCADIYVNPAISEGFGIATVEAMLCELPIICANSGSLPELLNHNQEGLIFEPRNVDNLCQCILKLYQLRELREAFGKAARRKALKKFGVHKFVQSFEEKYISMIDSCRPS